MVGEKLTAVVVSVLSAVTFGVLAPAPARAGSGQYVITDAGDLLCDMLWTEIFCQYAPGYPFAPPDPRTGNPSNVAVIDMYGQVRWRTDTLRPYPDPVFTIPEGTARHLWAWTVQAVNGGFRFTSDYTAHGGFITAADLQLF